MTSQQVIVLSQLESQNSEIGSPPVKKGRHRRFEEARKLKQGGPEAFGFTTRDHEETKHTEDDEYAAIAERYGVTFEDDEDVDDD
jgi:hypothetical protein